MRIRSTIIAVILSRLVLFSSISIASEVKATLHAENAIAGIKYTVSNTAEIEIKNGSGSIEINVNDTNFNYNEDETCDNGTSEDVDEICGDGPSECTVETNLDGTEHKRINTVDNEKETSLTMDVISFSFLFEIFLFRWLIF